METILVADGDLQILHLLSGHLKNQGYRVLTFRDGRQALCAIAANEPDMIILDAKLPGMSGFELLRHIRRIPETRTTPVLILTALRAQWAISAAIAAGANGYLTKPFCLHDLMAHVDQLETKTPSSARHLH